MYLSLEHHMLVQYWLKNIQPLETASEGSEAPWDIHRSYLSNRRIRSQQNTPKYWEQMKIRKKEGRKECRKEGRKE